MAVLGIKKECNALPFFLGIDDINTLPSVPFYCKFLAVRACKSHIIHLKNFSGVIVFFFFSF